MQSSSTCCLVHAALLQTFKAKHQADAVAASLQVLSKIKQKTKAVVWWGHGRPEDDDVRALKSSKVPLYSFADFEALGKKNLKVQSLPRHACSRKSPCATRQPCMHRRDPMFVPLLGCNDAKSIMPLQKPIPPKADDVCTIMYTRCDAVCLMSSTDLGQHAPILAGLGQLVLLTSVECFSKQWHHGRPKGCGGDAPQHRLRYCGPCALHRGDWHQGALLTGRQRRDGGGGGGSGCCRSSNSSRPLSSTACCCLKLPAPDRPTMIR